MTILGIRWTAREWTEQLSTRLAHAPQVERLRIDGPLRLALWHEGRGPYLIDATRAYEAYSRSTDTALLDTTVASIIASLARLDEPPAWDDARESVMPWLLRPEHAAGRATAGTFGDLTIAFRFMTPMTGIPAFVVPPAWGVDRDTLMQRALANLARTHDRPLFRPLVDAPDLFRMVSSEGMTASHILLPTVQRAIHTKVGSPAVVLIAAADAVFVCAPNVLGDAPRALRTSSEVRAALARPDALSETPVLLRDGRLASR
jgi:hypothetical protein